MEKQSLPECRFVDIRGGGCCCCCCSCVCVVECVLSVWTLELLLPPFLVMMHSPGSIPQIYSFLGKFLFSLLGKFRPFQTGTILIFMNAYKPKITDTTFNTATSALILAFAAFTAFFCRSLKMWYQMIC